MTDICQQQFAVTKGGMVQLGQGYPFNFPGGWLVGLILDLTPGDVEARFELTNKTNPD